MTITILAHPRADEIGANHAEATVDLPRIATLRIGEITLIFRPEQADALLAIATCATRAYELLTAPAKEATREGSASYPAS